jgi:hypothetical protein
LPGKRSYGLECVAACDDAAFSGVTAVGVFSATAVGGVYRYIFGFAIIVGMAAKGLE